MKLKTTKYLLGILLLILVTASLSLYASYKFWTTIQRISIESNIPYSFAAINSILQGEYGKALDYEIDGLEKHLIELYGLEVLEGEPIMFNYYMREISRMDTLSPKLFSRGLYELDSIMMLNYPDIENFY